MFEIKCPKCGKKVSSFLDKLFRPVHTTVQCPFCRLHLELINAGLCHFISGIIFAAFLVLLFVIQPHFLWVWVILLGIACWFLDVFVVCLLGRWGIWSYALAESSKLRLLSAVNAVSTIVAAVWAFFMVKTILMPYYDLLTNFDLANDQMAETVEHYKEIFSVRGIIGMVIGLLSLATSGITGFIRGRMSRLALQKSLSQSLSKD